MPTNAFLSSTSIYPTYLGAYTANTYPNPIASWNGVTNAELYTFQGEQTLDHAKYYSGSIGMAKYYTSTGGPFQDQAPS